MSGGMAFWGNTQRTQITTVAGTSMPHGTRAKFQCVCTAANIMPAATQGHANIIIPAGASFQPAYLGFSQVQVLVTGLALQSTDFLIFDGGSSTQFYVWMNVNGGGSDPFDGDVGIEVSILSTDNTDQIAQKISDAIDVYFPQTTAFSDTITVQANNFNSNNMMFDCYDDNTGFGFSTDNGAASPSWNVYDGEGSGYNIWYTVDGVGTNPIEGSFAIEVDIGSGDSDATVASETQAAMFGSGYFPDVTVVSSTHLTFSSPGTNSYGADFSVDNGTANPVPITVSSITNGTWSPNFYFSGPTYGQYVAAFDIDGKNASFGAQVPVSIISTWTASEVATALGTQLTNAGSINVTVSSATVTWEWFIFGSTGQIHDAYVSPGTGFTLTLLDAGSDPPAISPYFLINDPKLGKYAFVFSIDGNYNPPTLSNTTISEISISFTDSANLIAQRMYDSVTFPVGPWQGNPPYPPTVSATNVVTLAALYRGQVTATADGAEPTNFTFVTLNKGS